MEILFSYVLSARYTTLTLSSRRRRRIEGRSSQTGCRPSLDTARKRAYSG